VFLLVFIIPLVFSYSYSPPPLISLHDSIYSYLMLFCCWTCNNFWGYSQGTHALSVFERLRLPVLFGVAVLFHIKQTLCVPMKSLRLPSILRTLIVSPEVRYPVFYLGVQIITFFPMIIGYRSIRTHSINTLFITHKCRLAWIGLDWCCPHAKDWFLALLRAR